jgi:hypothetical protein
VPGIQSPLASLIEQGLSAARGRGFETSVSRETAQEAFGAILGGLKAAVRYGEVNSALDLEGLALLGAAALTGLRSIEEEAPGVFAIERAVQALADLIRRTAPEATGW